MVAGKELLECRTCSYKMHADILTKELRHPIGLNSGDEVRNITFNHEEKLIFCCIRPDIASGECAIVIRDDGRLSEMNIKKLEKV